MACETWPMLTWNGALTSPHGFVDLSPWQFGGEKSMFFMHESLGYPMLANVQTNLQHPATMKLVKWTSIIYLCAKVCDHSPLRAKPSSCGQFNLDEYIYICIL
jgi:hypothetical protein